ncbi:MAG TPA: DUF423 domain-containing protein [Rariglobus sp.]|jgi:uncharacterized membrane protein YgdD (TMEM256/DUF423 family)|nr:DUF423 domain-containing protein [Rariglobus sp.]
MKKGLFCAGISGLTGVILGAFGAHVLKETLVGKGTVIIWETAVLYQLIHSVAILWANIPLLASSPAATKWAARASTAWLIGVSLFSGSLYLLALGGPKWLGPVTPAGGIFLLAGWICVLIFALKSLSDNKI